MFLNPVQDPMRRFSQLSAKLAERFRFTDGTTREAEELFGSPLPQLPEGHLGSEGEEQLLVELHPSLQRFAREVIAYFYRTLTSKDPAILPPWASGTRADPYSRYFDLLSEILTNIIESERRQGLLNLFWLAHSKQVVQTINDFFDSSSIKAYVKYQMHPLLAGLYRGVLTSVWQRFRSLREETLSYNLGSDFNTALIDSIIDDQLPLTELDLSKLTVVELAGQILVEQNKRFRISFKEFKEIFAICRDRLREGIQRKEEPLLSLIRRFLPSTFHERNLEDERSMLRILFNPRILTYLFMDYGGVGQRIMANSTLKAGLARGRGWLDLLNAYLDFVQALRRTEMIGVLRDIITLIPPGLDEAELKRLFAEGKLYRFQESAEILNAARKVTILFADLRGFTRTSEGGVSEGELVSSLYRVFDPLVPIVKRCGGKIDKFTGDGAMVIYGATKLSRDDELNAIRTALSLQAMMEELRRSGRTRFQMGIAIHTGRAQVAHFIVDEKDMDVTVIGRNVNIAGRLSGSGDKAKEEEAYQDGLGGSYASQVVGPRKVWVDEKGVLYNTGIAVSQDTVDGLARVVPLEPLEDQGKVGYRFFDESLQKKILLEYVGDAKFKGIERSIPIYSVDIG